MWIAQLPTSASPITEEEKGKGEQRLKFDLFPVMSNLQMAEMGTDSIQVAIEQYARTLTQNPWTVQFPTILRQVYLHHKIGHEKGDWWLQDRENVGLPISSSFAKGWDVLAMSGGRSLCLFGEWDGERLLPLSLWSEKTFMPLGDA